MFDSYVKARDLINAVKSEVDVACEIPNASYVLWLNALEQLLYGEFIKEQARLEIKIDDDFNGCAELNGIRFEDIHAVFAGDVQLIKTTALSGVIFPDSYYKTDNKLGVNLQNKHDKLTVIHFVRPELKTVDTADMVSDENVMLPIEFIDLAMAKLRGEAYKVMNEDALAAKWLSDYNILIENFRTWIQLKQPEFGM